LIAYEFVETALNDITINHWYHMHVLTLWICYSISLWKITSNSANILIFIVFRSIVFLLFESFCHEHLESGELKDGCICCLLSEIGIINRITSLRTGHSSSISSILLNRIDQSNKVTFGFRHFLVLDLDKPIADRNARGHLSCSSSQIAAWIETELIVR
jgi:hypothetical protein